MPNLGASVDTAANWKSNNPVPNPDELCIERDTGVMKFGDGSTAYNSLPTLGGGGSVLIARGTIISEMTSNVGVAIPSSETNFGSLTFAAPNNGRMQIRVRCQISISNANVIYPLFHLGSSSTGKEYGRLFQGRQYNNYGSHATYEGSLLLTGLSGNVTVYLSGMDFNNGGAALNDAQFEVYTA